jgi:predicted MFS family arabinose efflux permease
MESVPSQRRGFANSSYQAAFQAVQALTTPLGGWIIARSGFAPVFVGAAVLYLLAIVLLWLSLSSPPRLFQETSGDEPETHSAPVSISHVE